MPLYKYRALNTHGRVAGGTLAAGTERDLQQQLTQAGLLLIDVRLAVTRAGWWAMHQPVRLRDLVQFCLHMEQLARAGVRLNDALHDCAAATSHVRLREAITAIQGEVDGGAVLSSAIARRPALFSPLMVALVASGEATGKLEHAFKQLGHHLSWQENLRTRLRQAAAYPLFTLGAMLLVILFVMGYVVPQTSGFLHSMGVDLPPLTHALIDTAAFVRAAWLPVIAMLVFIFMLVYAITRHSHEAAYQRDRFILSLPLVGALIQKINLARFAHTLSLMVSSGIDLLPAFATATRAVHNRVLYESLQRVHEQVQAGNPLSLALRLSTNFPALVQRMLKIGEDTGSLIPALAYVADFYERDVQNAAQTVITALAPVLTLMAGGLLLWLTMAVFVPIYNALPGLL